MPLSELGTANVESDGQPIFHKNLQRVSYVVASMAGRSPVEAVFDLNDTLAERPLPEGYTAELAGEGEWKITVDVFRDLGLAFAAALVMIYVLLVGQTGSLSVPLVMMIAIPLTVIGIMPGFWLLNLFATPIARLPQPDLFHRHRHDRHDCPGRYRRAQLHYPDRLHRTYPRPWRCYACRSPD